MSCFPLFFFALDRPNYVITHLTNWYFRFRPSWKTVRAKLLQRYKDRIVITKTHSKEPVTCLVRLSHKILHDHWYTTKEANEQEERLRIVRTAATFSTTFEGLHTMSLSTHQRTRIWRYMIFTVTARARSMTVPSWRCYDIHLHR